MHKEPKKRGGRGRPLLIAFLFVSSSGFVVISPPKSTVGVTGLTASPPRMYLGRGMPTVTCHKKYMAV